MYTYIIIDDESLIRKGTIKKLSPLKDKVQCIGEAENGVEAIQLIMDSHPDIVILDMQMPVLDGTRLLPYLSEHYPDLPLIVISGYRDFDYMKHAISARAVDYVLKPFSREAICECMNNAINRLENDSAIHRQIMDSNEEKENAYYEYDIQILKNLILGYQSETVPISSHKLSFINNTHTVILMTLVFFQKLPGLAIQDWLESNGFGSLALYLPNPNQPQIGFLILFIPQDNRTSHYELVTEIANSLTTEMIHYDTTCIIGISQPYHELNELNTAFRETSTALNQQKLDPNASTSNCYYYGGEYEPKMLDWEFHDEFLFRIEAGMTEEISTLLEKLFTVYQSAPDYTLADVKYHCYYLSGQCYLILDNYLNHGEVKPVSNSMQNIVNNIFQLDELKTYYLRFFLNIAEMLKDQSVYAGNDVVDKIQTYIQRNYQKDLTQDFIASLFYLNRSYLSTLFKMKTGQKFTDYLNDIRIEKSKELLISSDRKMYQIAKAIGYDNVKYFFRVFKKKMKITPERYRLENKCPPKSNMAKQAVSK